jgi:2-polyprenyl-3-methyl-5-hydroxy-6-metoxy-1,4-benzoquinol methylase
MPNNLTLPPYKSLSHLEGKGNWAIRKYYQWPYSFFYRHKLKMIIKMMAPGMPYYNILDFGAGPGIFTLELNKHAYFVKSFDLKDPIDLRWQFDVIVCASVLEFVHHLDPTVQFLRKVLKPDGLLLVASPIDSALSRFYFRQIKDKNKRHSHKFIIQTISKHFKITEKRNWLNLYFSLKAV